MHPNYRLLCPLPIGVELVLPGQLLCSRQALRRHRVCNPSRSAGAASCGAAMRQLLRHSNAVHVRQRFHVLALPARRKIIEKRRRDVRLPTALQVLQEEAKSSAISSINSEPAREWPDRGCEAIHGEIVARYISVCLGISLFPAESRLISA